MDARFTLDNFMSQIGQVKKLSPMNKLVGIIPGMSDLTKNMGMDEGDVGGQMGRMRAIYDSMTKKERADTDVLDSNRRRRIARGAGVAVNEVSQFFKQFQMSRDMMYVVGGPRRSGDRSSLVLGLVTDHPTRRDPSYVHRPPARLPLRDLPWKLFACVALAVLATALVLFRFFP
jgi:signal recognition particle GTPase